MIQLIQHSKFISFWISIFC